MAQLPEWASDENFPAGSKPWNGQPTRVEPANTIKARGFAPGAKPPAGWFNYLFGILLDESNDQDTRLAALEVLTLQGAFDNSVAAGNDPTIKLKASGLGELFVIDDAVGRSVLKVNGGDGTVVQITPRSAGDLALEVRNGGVFAVLDDDGAGGFRLKAPPSISATYDVQVPTSAPTETSVMRRGAGSTAASDWVAMDWGDTDGGGSGWTATVSGMTSNYSVLNGSGGTWQRVGNVVSASYQYFVSGSGSTDISFEVALPVTPSASPKFVVALHIPKDESDTISMQCTMVTGTSRVKIEESLTTSGSTIKAGGSVFLQYRV
jgi:hypothetical protein